MIDDYQQFLAMRIADGVRRAVNNLEPARIGWGSAQEPNSVFNRRYFMKPGTPIRNPFGGEDKVMMNPGMAIPTFSRLLVRLTRKSPFYPFSRTTDVPLRCWRDVVSSFGVFDLCAQT